MMIGGYDLEERRFLIAEIGNNHEGDPVAAMDMVEAAAEAGADAVKVQVITPERLVNTVDQRRIAQLERFKLPIGVFQEMAHRANTLGMEFIATPFDLDSLNAIAPMVAAIKIASGDLDFTALLEAAAQTNKPIILSTGMGDLAEVGEAVRTIQGHLPQGQTVQNRLAVLHCVTAYPTAPRDANLRAMLSIRDAFNVTVGFSDHTLGVEVALLAGCLGARVIEKHFTLDKTRNTFRDHALSADSAELMRLATLLHTLDDIMGNGIKQSTASEATALAAVRRGVVASRDLPAGAALSMEDLDFVRGRGELKPANASGLVGRKLRVAVKRHEVLSRSHLD